MKVSIVMGLCRYYYVVDGDGCRYCYVVNGGGSSVGRCRDGTFRVSGTDPGVRGSECWLCVHGEKEDKK